jgi:5'(3')-deoxyribonucleotidase
MLTWSTGFVHPWCKGHGYYDITHQKRNIKKWDITETILEHCPKLYKMNTKYTHFRAASFTNFLETSATASITSIYKMSQKRKSAP